MRVGGVHRREPVLELVPRRAGDPHLDPRHGPEQGQRAGDVVAVAHIGDDEALEPPEALLQRQQVGERLAGMVAPA